MSKDTSKPSGVEGKANVPAQKMREFAKVYNDFKNYPLTHDLFRILFPTNGTVSDKKLQRKMIRRAAERYRMYSQKHPDQHLPELILRTKDGRMIAIPEGVREQLAEYQINVKDVLKAGGYIVTSAQFGATLNRDFWKSLTLYAKHRGFQLVVLPIKYGSVKTVYQKELNKRVLTTTFDPELKGHILFEPLDVADGMLGLNVMRMRPTLGKFLSNPVCERGGNTSQIFAAPKLELEYRMRLQHDYPKACMTTGAVTHPDYQADNLGQQDRTGEIAAGEHTYSAIIVELSAKRTFHFRQLLADSAGEFYDIDPVRGGAIYVTPKGIEHRPNSVVGAYLGDWHSGVTHPDIKDITFCDMLRALDPKHVIFGDAFNGHSISHHDEKQASRRTYKAVQGLDSLETELNGLVADMHWMHEKLPKATLVSLASNHNDALARYIQEKRWVNDQVNMAVGAKLFSAIHDKMVALKPKLHEMTTPDPVHGWLNQYAPFVKTLSRKDRLLLPESPESKKILCSLHGDVGPSGMRAGGMNAFRQCNQWVIIGHSHSAAIQGPVWRVGTSTYLTEHYVDAPRTKWTHTHALIYANGQRQMINIVNGAWHGQRRTRPRSAGIGAEVNRKKRGK